MTAPVAGPPALPPGIQAKCDAQLAVIWPQLQADEDAYRAAHGRYWQGLITHQAIPENGDDALPDVGTTVPTDQPAPWPPDYLDQPIAIALTVDMYDGPAGQGYRLIAQVQTTPPQVPPEAAHRYWRALAVGPEPGWDHEWAPVPPPAAP